MTDINPLVVDLSHWDPAKDYGAVKQEGIVGVIFKATQGSTMSDATYVAQQHAAKAAGLKWGAYHFGDGSSVEKQISNFLKFASPDLDELFALDWEDNGANTMSLTDAKLWIEGVEEALKRPGQCVLYSGNTAKEALGSTVDKVLGARRLWLATYSSNPVCQKSWQTYWLWQFTDGRVGPAPHEINGIGPCDINSYAHGVEQLKAEWATGTAVAPAPTPSPLMINVLITTPPGVTMQVRQAVAGQVQAPKPDRSYEAAKL